MYHYDVEGRLIAESNQKGAMLKEYLWLDGELIAAAEGSKLYFAHRDYRNQPCLVTDKDGAAVWKAVSSPFGAARVLSPSRPGFGNSAETPNQNTETIGSFTPFFTKNLKLQKILIAPFKKMKRPRPKAAGAKRSGCTQWCA